MKKIILAVALVCSTLGFSQDKVSEGVVTTKQTMSSDNEQVNMQLAMMGEMITTTYFKGDKSRSELSNPMQGDITTIMDAATNKMLVMVNSPMLGKKYTINDMMPKEEDLKDVTVTESTETKTILGYVCKRYDILVKKQGVSVNMTLFATDKLSALSQQAAGLGKRVAGFPLYSEMKMNQMGAEMIIKMEATDLKKESVSDDKFDMTALEGYEKSEQLGM
ncbi:MAG: hypothetical protein ACPG45_01355 [Flavobacteriaceae bacterium]